MPLHNAKRIAILQWYNSFSSFDLSTIGQLSDGQYFCDIIRSVFKKNPDLPANISPAEIGSLKTEAEPIPIDVDVRTETDPIPIDVDLKSENDPIPTPIDVDLNPEIESCEIDTDLKPQTDPNLIDVDSKAETEPPHIDVKVKTESCVIDIDANSETEPYPFDMQESEAASIEKEVKYIQSELSKVLVKKSDANSFEGELGASNENKCDVIKEDTSGDNKVPVIHEAKAVDVSEGSAFSNIKTESKSNITAKSGKFSKNEMIKLRFDFIKEFIDENYNISSSDIVDYSQCMNSIELELANVGILILSLVVKHFLKTKKNDKLNTLTHLDQKVQEDIQECLSILLQETISKKEIQRILTSAARYKASIRKSPRGVVTPPRGASLRCRKSLTMTPSNDDIFTDSPLRSFLESPQFKKVLVSKDKELAKTRKTLHAEEIRSEELQFEVNRLRKALEQKGIEIKKLKKDISELKSKEMEVEECETCVHLKNELKLAKRSIKELEEEDLRKEKSYEEENGKLMHQITMLQGKVQLLTRPSMDSLGHLPKGMKEIVKNKDEEVRMLKALNNKLKAQLEDMLRRYSFVQPQVHTENGEEENEEREVSLVQTASPVRGECLGTVIEEENKVLRQRLLASQSILDKLLKKWGISREIGVDFKNTLDFLCKCDIRLLDSSQLSESAKAHSFNETDSINVSKLSTDSNVSTSSLSSPKNVTTGVRSSLRRRKANSSSDKESAASHSGLGLLWTQYSNSSTAGDSSIEPVVSNNTDDNNKLSLFKHLGFHEAEYPAKIESMKKLLTLLKELFKQNGSNGLICLPALGEWDQTVNTDEDCIKCLFYIRESLLKFQNNSSILPSKEVVAEKNACNSDSNLDTLVCLQKENVDLKAKLSESYALSSSEIAEKTAELLEMSTKLEAVEHQNQELFKTREDLQIQNKELFKKLEVLKTQINKMSQKINETEHIKSLYTNLLNEKSDIELKFKRQIKICREKLLNFDLEKRGLQATIEKEKKVAKERMSQIELFKSEIVTLKIQRKSLDKHIRDLRIEKKQLSSHNHILKERLVHQKMAHDRIIAFSASNSSLNNIRSQSESSDMVQNIYNINVERGMVQNSNKVNIEVEQKTHKGLTVPEFNGPGLNSINHFESFPPDTCNESSMSSAVFNKSVHGSLMLFTDDEEGFLNHSSIAEIKKDYDPSEKVERIQELKRRNTLYLPHMQSSYPIELQNMSPFNKSLYDHIRKPLEETEKVKIEERNISMPAVEHASKKRKIFEFEQQRAGPSTAIAATPDIKLRKTFKTPASLKKLLNYRRKQRPDLAKPKT